MRPESKGNRPRGVPFVKGDPRAGRPKGTRNKVAEEVREVAARLVDDLEYQERLRARLVVGKLMPGVESMLWHYAYGKPKESIELTGQSGGPLQILNLTTAERVAYLKGILDKAAHEDDDWADDDANTGESVDDDGKT